MNIELEMKGIVMLKKLLMVLPILLLSLSIAFTQGRGGGQGAGRGQGSGQGQSVGQGQGSGQHQGIGQGQGSGQGQGVEQRDQKRIKSSIQQRDQIRTCDKLADGVRKQAQKMGKNSGNKFNAEEANLQRDQLREQIRAMKQEHERLVNGLDDTQKQAWKEQIRDMDQLQQRLHTHLQEMQSEQRADPDGQRNAERAREIERIMKNWTSQYSVLESEAAS